MCLMNVLNYLLRICGILQLNRLTDALMRTANLRPFLTALVILGFLIGFILSFTYHAFYLAYILLLVGSLIFIIPTAVCLLRYAVDESKTHGVEAQTIRVGYIADPDPEAPLLTAAEQQSVIRAPESTAGWSTEPLRQQPALFEDEVREYIYKRMEETCRPRSQKHIPQQSDKQKFETWGSQMTSTSIQRRRTRSSTSLDNQQPSTSRENPCIANVVPDIQYDPPTDTSESSEMVHEAVCDKHLLSALPYSKPRRSRKETGQDSALLVAESSCGTIIKGLPGKKTKDSKFSRGKKSEILHMAFSTERTEKSLIEAEITQQHMFSFEGPSLQQTDYMILPGSSLQTEMSGSEHDSIVTTDEPSPSRSADTGTTETTLSDNSENSGSRHSSPEDAKKFHISRSRKNS